VEEKEIKITQRTKKPYRKKPAHTEGDDVSQQYDLSAVVDAGGAEAVRLKLLQTKELQKLRGRSKGVNAGVHSDLNLPPPDAQEERASTRLDSNFTSQNDSKPEINQHQEKYIEEMMKKRERESIATSGDGTINNNNSNGEGGGEGGAPAAPKKPFPGSDADLYTTPDHLKPQTKAPSSDTTNWLTGIVEVQLPVEYKLKNIEETEKAKRELMNQVQPAARNTYGEANLYGPSFASIRYQTDRQAKRVVTTTSSSSSSVTSTSTGNERATDDLVMERFKKRFRK